MKRSREMKRREEKRREEKRREEKRREEKRREEKSVRSDQKYLIVCTADLEACNQYD